MGAANECIQSESGILVSPRLPKQGEVQFRVGFSPPEGAYVTLPQKPMCPTAPFKGPLELLEKEQYGGLNIWNEAKKCNSCGKSCAAMLSVCNGCGEELSDELTKTPNALLAFAFGVETIGTGQEARSAKFSLRYQDPRVFVFDDMVSRTPIHFCCVPSEVIRDVKELLNRDDALEILTTLGEAGWKAVEDMITPEWLSMMECSLPRLRTLLLQGFNAAPSQFQLHLHVMVPPLLPEDFYLTLSGSRFTRQRWLPLEYVRACAAVSPRPHLGPEDDIIEVFDALGHFNYDVMMDATVEHYISASEELSLWREEWFTHAVIDGKIVDRDGNELDDSIYEWVKRDKHNMQNCGRPYVNDRPTPINFYGYAKKVHPEREAAPY